MEWILILLNTKLDRINRIKWIINSPQAIGIYRSLQESGKKSWKIL
jgi:hypothetical protein